MVVDRRLSDSLIIISLATYTSASFSLSLYIYIYIDTCRLWQNHSWGETDPCHRSPRQRRREQNPWMRPQVEAKGRQTSRLEPPNQKNTFDGATDPYHRSPQKKRERRTNRLEPHNLSTVYAKSRQVSQQEIESVRYVRKSVS